jgi:hypothetical protein
MGWVCSWNGKKRTAYRILPEELIENIQLEYREGHGCITLRWPLGKSVEKTEADYSDPGSCSKASFDISGVDPCDSATTGAAVR